MLPCSSTPAAPPPSTPAMNGAYPSTPQGQRAPVSPPVPALRARLEREAKRSTQPPVNECKSTVTTHSPAPATQEEHTTLDSPPPTPAAPPNTARNSLTLPCPGHAEVTAIEAKLDELVALVTANAASMAALQTLVTSHGAKVATLLQAQDNHAAQVETFKADLQAARERCDALALELQAANAEVHRLRAAASARSQEEAEVSVLLDDPPRHDGAAPGPLTPPPHRGRPMALHPAVQLLRGNVPSLPELAPSSPFTFNPKV